jgi:hypothetical protein
LKKKCPRKFPFQIACAVCGRGLDWEEKTRGTHGGRAILGHTMAILCDENRRYSLNTHYSDSRSVIKCTTNNCQWCLFINTAINVDPSIQGESKYSSTLHIDSKLNIQRISSQLHMSGGRQSMIITEI